MHQSAPNPFDPTVTIGFDLPEMVHVRLEIYNASGRCVRTLMAAEREAGHYTVTWDGCNNLGHKVVQGLYFARLTAGSFTKTQKLVRLR
jgi:flagellar hook assembly protein FlgD